MVLSKDLPQKNEDQKLSSFSNLDEVESPFPAYSGKNPYIFVSYSHSDKFFVYPEINRLHQLGFRIWYDEGIDPGNEWPDEVAKALKKCSLFLVFISPRAVMSKNVKNEINFAIKHGKQFLQIDIEETILPHGLDLQMGSNQAIFKYKMPDDRYYIKMSKVLPGILIIDEPDSQLEDSKNDNSNIFFKKNSSKNIKIHYYPEQPPVIDEFVDRITYLESLKDSLNKNMIVIQGIAGIGKTHIAAKFKEIIDSECNFHTSWKEMRDSDSFDTIAPCFAGVFHENGDSELAEYISEENSDRGIITNIIISTLKKKKYVFFFDNYHEVKNEEIHQLFATLKDAILNSTIVITTRTEPFFIGMADLIKKTISSELIEGFDQTAMKEYLDTKNIVTSPEYINKLNQRVNGHPLILSLIVTLASGSDLKDIISNIPEINIDKYLYDDIYKRLAFEEQELLKVSSIFRIPFKAEACISTSDVENIKQLLIDIEGKFLLKRKGQLYYLHDLIRENSYNRIDNPKEYHRKAAEYYSNLEKNGANISETIYHSTKYSGGLSDDEIKYLIDLPSDLYTNLMIIGFLDKYPIISSIFYDLLQKMLSDSNEKVRYLCVKILIDNANLDFDRSLELLMKLVRKKGESDFVLSNLSHNFSVLLSINVEKCLFLIDEILNEGSEYTVQTLCFAFRDYQHKNQLILERLHRISDEIYLKYSDSTRQLAINIAKEIETNDCKSILSAINNKVKVSSLENIIRENINYSSTIDLLTFSLLLERELAVNKKDCYTLIQDSVNNFIPIAILPSYVVSNSLISHDGINVEIAKKLILSGEFSFQATAFMATLQSYSIIKFLGKKYKLEDESFSLFYELIQDQCCEILETFNFANNNEISHLSSALLAEIKQPTIKKNKVSEKILGQVSGTISKIVSPNLFKNYADATSFEGNYKEYYRIDFISLMGLAGANPYHIIDKITEEEKRINIDKIVIPTYYDIVQKSPEKILDIIEVVNRNTHSFVGKYAIITWSYLSLLVTPEQTINFLKKLSSDSSYQNVELKIEMIYIVTILRKWLNLINQNSSKNSIELLKINQLAEDFIVRFKDDEMNEVRQFADFVLQ